jgi:hypothetical protein
MALVNAASRMHEIHMAIPPLPFPDYPSCLVSQKSSAKGSKESPIETDVKIGNFRVVQTASGRFADAP